MAASEYFDQTTDCVYVADERWTIIYCNKPADRELGLRSLIGKTVWDAFPAARGTQFEERFVRARETRSVEVFEAYYEPLEQWYDVHAVPVADGLIISFRNISARKKAQLKAEETAALLDAIINSAEDLIFVKGLDGRFVLTNKQLENAGPSLIGRKVDDEYLPDLAAGYAAADRQVFETGVPAVVEEMIPIRGEQRMFQTIKVPWIVNGAIRGLIGVSRDITERLRAETRVRQSEERYRFAAKATNDAVWDWDLASGEIAWTQAIETLAREAPLPSIGWWEDRIHPDDREQVLGHLAAFLETGGEHWEQEYRFRRADGSYAFVLDRGYVIHDEQRRPVRMIGAMADLSQRVEAQRRLDQLQNELAHVSRVSAMGTMASTLAHEINQPLAAIANYCAAARRLVDKRQAGNAETIAGILKDASQEVNRVGEMIRRIRRMVAHGQAQIQPVPVKALVEDALRLALPNPHLGGVAISLDVGPDMRVEADPIQIQQVLINLIRNALEAMEGRATRILSIEARAKGGLVELRVGDTGCGIPDDLREGLFTAFRSTKAEGLGVGLTICRTIVEAHGGRMSLVSSGAEGTVIGFELRSAMLEASR
ncbi:MAG TPA: PAS domain-containing protein [Sphingomonas sp.]|nr:PAS domain-containing protein [Sphingomonas sp.]